MSIGLKVARSKIGGVIENRLFQPTTALGGLATYGLLVTLYLVCLGFRGEWVGPLLWPAVALHALLAMLLAREWFRAERG